MADNNTPIIPMLAYENGAEVMDWILAGAGSAYIRSECNLVYGSAKPHAH